MSLINEALKRAKDAQQKSQPGASGPQFRPPEPAPQPKHGMGMAVPVVITLLVVAGTLFVWINQHNSAAPKSAPETKTAVVVPETKPRVQVAMTTPAPTPPVVAPPTPAAAPAPELKLQAIFFSPGHSSAIISGKTVRVGNILKGYRVTAITEASATLVSATQTNVMTLDQ